MTCQEAIDVMDDAMEGRLPRGPRKGFDAHMAECVPCATYFDHLRLTRQALRYQRASGGTSPHRDELIEAFKKETERKPD